MTDKVYKCQIIIIIDFFNDYCQVLTVKRRIVKFSYFLTDKQEENAYLIMLSYLFYIY